MGLTLDLRCEVDGTEGECITYRFYENDTVLESGWTTGFKIVDQRFAAWCRVREWAAAYRARVI